MSSEQDDEFLPEDEMMEELPEDSFLPDEEVENQEGTEETEIADDSETADESETVEGAEEAVPDFSPEDEATEEEDEEAGEEPESDKPIEYRPPRMDLYTMLLVLSLIFVSLAAVIHWLEVPPTEYGTPPFKKNSPVMTAPKTP